MTDLKLSDSSDDSEPKEIIVTPFIFHTVQHKRLPDGAILMENVVTDGDPPEMFARFITPVTVPIGKNHGTGQTIEVQTIIPIDAQSVEEAFELLKETVEAAIDDIRKKGQAELKKARKPKIVVPGLNAPSQNTKADLNGFDRGLKFPGI